MARSLVLKPEMTGKILDESHWNFHVVCKAQVINAVNKLRKGTDFLVSLSKLGFKTDKRWTANTSKNPNVAVLLEILEEYKQQEHRPSRAKLLTPIIEYAIGLYASDLFYVERGEWFLYKICSNAHRFTFHSCFVDPSNWYPRRRYAGIDEEAPDAPSIEEEYKLWYGVDPIDDNCFISYDMSRKEDLIRQQNEWFEREIVNKERWAKTELEKI
jgi:hypothetical protein